VQSEVPEGSKRSTKQVSFPSFSANPLPVSNPKVPFSPNFNIIELHFRLKTRAAMTVLISLELLN
jgi:hypothetical protein